MAIIYPNAGGGGSVWSVDLTARRKDVMENKTAIVSDSNDASVSGTLPLNAIKLENGGNLQINGITSFSVSQSNTTPNTVVFTFGITAKTAQPWSGIYIRYKEGGYPSSITDGSECGYYSQSGGTFTFGATTDNKTWYFRAWNFYRYSETVSDPQTYPLIKWGTYMSATCQVKRLPVPYVVSFVGGSDEISNSWTSPIGYTHVSFAVIGPGGSSGCSYEYDRDQYTYYDSQHRHNGAGGGEGGQVITGTANISSGTTFNYKTGKQSTSGYTDEYENDTSSYWVWYTKSPYVSGTAGSATTLSFGNNSYSAAAGHCATSASSWGAGGTGGPGADGGSGGGTWDSSPQSSVGGNGANGTYFAGTGLYYGGGGRGTSAEEERHTDKTDRDNRGTDGTPGAGQSNYGGGGNASWGNSSNRGNVGAVILVLS